MGTPLPVVPLTPGFHHIHSIDKSQTFAPLGLPDPGPSDVIWNVTKLSSGRWTIGLPNSTVFLAHNSTDFQSPGKRSSQPPNVYLVEFRGDPVNWPPVYNDYDIWPVYKSKKPNCHMVTVHNKEPIQVVAMTAGTWPENTVLKESTGSDEEILVFEQALNY